MRARGRGATGRKASAQAELPAELGAQSELLELPEDEPLEDESDLEDFESDEPEEESDEESDFDEPPSLDPDDAFEEPFFA
jgi:hypothetical protein